jgi:hypothetical protein
VVVAKKLEIELSAGDDDSGVKLSAPETIILLKPVSRKAKNA